MTPAAPRVTRRTRWARAAVSAVFFVHGAVFASWAARIPAEQGVLHLSAGILGLVLAGPGLGALAGSQAGGLLVGRLGSRAVSAMAPVLLSVPLALVPTARSAWPLFGLLVLLGAADGCTSVAMNAQAVAVQHVYGRAVINGMHGVRSIGAVAGGLAGVATAAAGWTLTAQFVVSAVVLGAVSAVAACGPPAGDGPPPPATGAERAPNRAALVWGLALMTFLAALVEDAPASWSGVYLRLSGAGPAAAAAGYAAFCAGETVTRLFNDPLVDRMGWPRLIRTGTLCCAAALATALLLGRPALTLVALVVAGAGISAVFPAAFATAGALPAPASAMAQLGFSGNLGWLLVSPLVGGLATVLGLPTALGVLVVAALAIATAAPLTRSGSGPAAVRAAGGAGEELSGGRGQTGA